MKVVDAAPAAGGTGGGARAGAGRALLVERIGELRTRLDRARASGRTVGLVPTMGALHEGHLSLVRRSAAECDLTAVSVFVNPLQFGAGEGYESYPRDLGRDADLASAAGSAVVFAPSVEEMYPEPPSTRVSVAGVAEGLEGASRPGHFEGVATVVAKLLNAAGPCRAYFGEKDYQQLLVVRRLVRDLSFPVEVVACPTRRDRDGLALSSRNVLLSPERRRAASVLYRALTSAASAVEQGERDPERVRRRLREVVAAEPRAELDYAEVVSAADLRPAARLSGELRLMVAARFGSVRLIDNLALTVPDPGS